MLGWSTLRNPSLVYSVYPEENMTSFMPILIHTLITFEIRRMSAISYNGASTSRKAKRQRTLDISWHLLVLICTFEGLNPGLPGRNEELARWFEEFGSGSPGCAESSYFDGFDFAKHIE